MSADLDAFQALLAKMRNEFLGELPERCDRLDELILLLEKYPDTRDAFNELFRGVHSLKGSGGTHGLSIITTICHQLENHLTEADTNARFDQDFANRALAYVDLLRRVELLAQHNNPNYAALESDLEALRQSVLQNRKNGLVVESSPMMSTVYRQILASLPVQLTHVDNGMIALERLLHEHFDFVIVAREVPELNGIALLLALRASQTANQQIPAILLSSKLDAISEHAGFTATISRDTHLSVNLLAAVNVLLK